MMRVKAAAVVQLDQVCATEVNDGGAVRSEIPLTETGGRPMDCNTSVATVAK